MRRTASRTDLRTAMNFFFSRVEQFLHFATCRHDLILFRCNVFVVVYSLIPHVMLCNLINNCLQDTNLQPPCLMQTNPCRCLIQCEHSRLMQANKGTHSGMSLCKRRRRNELSIKNNNFYIICTEFYQISSRHTSIYTARGKSHQVDSRPFTFANRQTTLEAADRVTGPPFGALLLGPLTALKVSL